MKMKKIAIVTGSSQGLGFNLAESFLKLNYIVVGISRSKNEILHDNYYFFKHDLSTKTDISTKLKNFLIKHKISSPTLEHVTLINNAASILPINYFHKLNLEQIQASYQLNLHAPMMLSHFVINHFQKKSKNILICHISSGAAFHPLINWSHYCVMKSGLKMLSDCLNKDYVNDRNIKSINFIPGIMDTHMQKSIRKQKAGTFQNVLKFREYKKNDQLLSPEFVAHKLCHLLANPNQIIKGEYSINEL